MRNWYRLKRWVRENPKTVIDGMMTTVMTGLAIAGVGFALSGVHMLSFADSVSRIAFGGGTFLVSILYMAFNKIPSED